MMVSATDISYFVTGLRQVVNKSGQTQEEFAAVMYPAVAIRSTTLIIFGQLFLECICPPFQHTGVIVEF